MELIFEIGCEELPARFVEPALAQIESLFVQGCRDRRITVDQTNVMGTPRRLTLTVANLADDQDDLSEERTGPPAHIAYDDDGQPTGAAKGFARGQGVDVDDLYTVENDKGQYLAAQVFEKGAPTADLLPEILTEVLEAIRFPKSMRWDSHRPTFGRPVRWLLAMADGQVIDVSFNDVHSANQTYGHRFSAPEPIAVDSVDSYLTGLKEADVVIDADQRREFITNALKEQGQAAGGVVVDDPELVDEVTYLIEKPHAVTLEFDADYLELPREVLVSSMRSHQRYFAIEEEDGQALKNACVVIYNTPVHDPAVVAEGNLKVLRARLDDARFFFDKDLEQNLEDHRQHLNQVIWIGPLGTLFDRTKRMADLAASIAAGMGLTGDARQHAKRAGELSKADLVTQMVNEFPDLQGVMGRAYARRSGADQAVACAIEEQYLPTGADGRLPKSDVGAAVALAEKLDAIVGCFGVDMKPSSASDPYGLRRAALGIVRILQDRDLTIPLRDLVALALDAYRTEVGETPFANDDAVISDVTDFIVTRQRYLLEDEFPTDVVNSVLAAGVTDIPAASARVEALANLRGEADFEPLAQGFRRVVNILNKQAEHLDFDTLSVDADALAEPQEKALFQAYESAQGAVNTYIADLRWDEACQTLIGLKAPVDDFFDHVMVMADDDALRHNRIALLAALRELFFKVADISKIQA